MKDGEWHPVLMSTGVLMVNGAKLDIRTEDGFMAFLMRVPLHSMGRA